MTMWKKYKEMNKISEDISGIYDRGKIPYTPYYVRFDEKNGLEYTTEEQLKPEYPDELFETRAGRIGLYDEGEFGGHLEIGGKFICSGNFSKIFKFKGGTYVLDDLQHMGCRTFRLLRVNDDGTVEEVYNADEFAGLHREYAAYIDSLMDGIDMRGKSEIDRLKMRMKMKRAVEIPEVIQKYQLHMLCEVGMDAFCISRDVSGAESVFFLCGGDIVDLDEHGLDRFQNVQYLLWYNPDRTTAPFIRTELPENVRYDLATSIWTDGETLAIGCDNEVVRVSLPFMEVEYRTELAGKMLTKLLNAKQRGG